MHFRCYSCPSLSCGAQQKYAHTWIRQNPTPSHLYHSPVKRCRHHPPSSHPCQLQLLGTQERTMLFPLPASLCLLRCAVFASHSLYTAERTAVLRICHSSLQKMSFCLKHAWQRTRIWFSSPVAAWTRSNFLHLITKGMRWKWACETGAACLIDLLHQNLSFQSFFLLPYFHFYLLQGSRSRLK